MTTAAIIPLAGGGDLGCALDHYVAAVGVTLLAPIVLRLVKFFEGLYRRSG